MDKKEISWRQNMTDGKREIIRQRLSEYEIQTTQDIQVLKICLCQFQLQQFQMEVRRIGWKFKRYYSSFSIFLSSTLEFIISKVR